MKYGEHFASESAPQWSFYNIDYNSLKHYIKVHTTRDQATAIAIPGHQDTALRKFEDELYTELCRQHDRVGLFVSSKADEITRRLQYLSNHIPRLVLRCTASGLERVSAKRHRRFVKFEQELLECGDELRSLRRFVDAQVVAFRKILKKYRKWTGSSSLGSRFSDVVLSHPKSFTRREFTHLQSECDGLLDILRASSPDTTGSASSPAPGTVTPPVPRQDEVLSPSETIAVPEPQQVGYWNEYDHGSEAGDTYPSQDTNYAILIDPKAEQGFPGISTLTTFFTTRIKGMNRWKAVQQRYEEYEGERGPLLSAPTGSYGSAGGSYFGSPPGGAGSLSETEAEDEPSPIGTHRGRRGSYGYASSTEEFPVGYKAHYATLPSIEDQALARYREGVLFWGTWACFAMSFVLMGIAGVLVLTGRHKMRLEVDTGATLGIVASLGAAGAALGMTCSRQDRLRLAHRLVVWFVFTITCVLNGALLVFVVGNTPL